MPRPGPRPYECVRRAWHSDRHQPIKGSLIQEIFRVVNEVHCPATKKNKEWQEKLPIVVLKAEEILYSKANSESEYMDLETLLERMNDAINTIIRRDESTETGVLLHPCIEAALTLGCTPRRASRSQRNCSPQRYLNSISQEKAILGKEIPSSNQTSLCPNTFQANCSNTNHGLVCHCATLCNSHLGPHTPPGMYSVYPLYYGSSFPEAKFQFHQDCSSKVTKFQNLGSMVDELNEEEESGSGIRCDLSLRLGPHLDQVFANIVSSSSAEATKLSSERARRDNESSIFPHMKNPTWMHDSLQMADPDISLKKQKLSYGPKYMEDQPRCNANVTEELVS
ncbi:hypothetical protein SAY86_027584 [Trapa natans]|uniref:Histone acetyltransferase n=1 Tax=Trapa natans TaxID=22666 RepID=A0AAN7KLS1_TRANT|nr:hypothetical protein SAY86_027584 [Trapa natans]